jgi:hypothetical protein
MYIWYRVVNERRTVIIVKIGHGGDISRGR